MITALTLALLGSQPIPPACSVMTKLEAQSYVGEPIERVFGEDPELDDEVGGMHTTCTFMGKTKALVISLTEFKSAAAAAKKVTAEYLANQDNGDDGPPAKIEPEGGLGDKAFYGRSAHAAMVLMLKGTRTYGAVLGGGLPAGADPRASLRKIVVGVAAKVS